MIEKLEFMVFKYSTSCNWEGHPLAMDLVSSLTMYVDQMKYELEEMQNMAAPPTRAPTAAYHKSLLSWYSDLGEETDMTRPRSRQCMVTGLM
eukprot:15364713-Ditylum_brightwellii.AAC.3